MTIWKYKYSLQLTGQVTSAQLGPQSLALGLPGWTKVLVFWFAGLNKGFLVFWNKKEQKMMQKALLKLTFKICIEACSSNFQTNIWSLSLFLLYRGGDIVGELDAGEVKKFQNFQKFSKFSKKLKIFKKVQSFQKNQTFYRGGDIVGELDTGEVGGRQIRRVSVLVHSAHQEHVTEIQSEIRRCPVA